MAVHAAVQHEGAPMSEARVIKKYPNRRLYDTVESRYITLADIRRLVVDKIDFVVVDKKTQEDITRSILLQVIAEQEHDGQGQPAPTVGRPPAPGRGRQHRQRQDGPDRGRDQPVADPGRRPER